jgi:hypothetical protein
MFELTHKKNFHLVRVYLSTAENCAEPPVVRRRGGPTGCSIPPLSVTLDVAEKRPNFKPGGLFVLAELHLIGGRTAVRIR